MHNAPSIIVLAALSIPVLAQVAGIGLQFGENHYTDGFAPPTPISRVGSADGKAFTTSVARTEVYKTPRWAFTEEHPPLSPRKAEQLAALRLADTVSDSSLWLLRDINMESAGDGDHWVYDVRFVRGWPEYNSGPPPHPTLHFLVLMDGRVIDPQKSDK